MLKNLHIQNYALIDNLDIDFESGFSVITGETGAGKSILLGALALVLGGRADTAAISPGAKRCVAEAIFSISNPDISAFLEDHDLDADGDECIIRRELTAAGKSRAFINDTPVALSTMKDLSLLLIDIHSQHQNLLLNNGFFLLDVIDSVANNETELNEYTTQYALLRKSEKELREIETQSKNRAEDLDRLQFHHKELTAANLVEHEQEDLEQEQLMLNNAESIKEALYGASQSINDLLDNLRSAHSSLNRIANVYPQAAPFATRIESCNIELDDISSELSSKLNDIEFDPERADFVNDRLSTIYTLQKKFHAESVAALIELRDSTAKEIDNITNCDELIEEKRQECDKLRKLVTKAAESISLSRQKAALSVEEYIASQLRSLGMPDVVFKVEISKTEDFTPRGNDNVCFLFSSNKNMPPRNLSKIASGGEMARVMLSLKALLSFHKELPTIIFDEIDTGVSGKISEKMAVLMNEMTQHDRQVICITHQPQIAAKGQHHYRVYKDSTTDATHTHIEKLNNEERVGEIAKMLSGEIITDAAISNAKTLLKQ
ncbi:MAG: DNA repair protein RecN [Prevotellaceae bacterium]|nr:DNA repair protein RecN [Prevotellaceae bacterium]